MKKQLLTITLAGTLAAGMLAGCAGDSNDAEDKNDSAEISSAEQTDKEDTEGAVSEEDVKYMVENEVIPAYEAYVKEIAMSTSQQPYSFIYLNEDAIPELVVQGDCEASGNMICTYINNEVVALQTSRLHFTYIPKQNLLNNSGGNMGVYYDRIYSIADKDFALVNDGKWTEEYDDDYKVLFEYSWNGQAVSSDEYNNYLAQVYDSEKATDSYDMTYYPSIQEAYENISIIKYSVDCSEVYQFEMIDDRLIVRTDGEDSFSIGYPISSDCIWYRCYVGNEDEVSESLSFEEIKEHLEGIRQDAKVGEYTCWNGLGLRIQNNEVTRVYIIAQ